MRTASRRVASARASVAPLGCASVLAPAPHPSPSAHPGRYACGFVLAVGADTRAAPLSTGLTPVGGQIIVLEVTPQEAERIQWAATYSALSLVLLPSDGTYVPYDAQPVVVDDIFGLLDRISAELGLVLGDQGN